MYHDGESLGPTAKGQFLADFVVGMFKERNNEESTFFKNIWDKGKSYWLKIAAKEQGIDLFENKNVNQTADNGQLEQKEDVKKEPQEKKKKKEEEKEKK